MGLGDLNTSATWEKTGVDLKQELRKWGKTGQVQERVYCAKVHEVILMVHSEVEPIQLTCNKFDTPEQNIRAIFQAVHMMRMIDQRGIGSIVVMGRKLMGLPSGERSISSNDRSVVVVD